ENLARLLEVAKEKERLQSELEIAREVQSQLYPRAMPEVIGLRLCAVCKPARLVSGDYYDYIPLPGGRLAIAIADVAGKGISAALLTATVQSMVRTHIHTAHEGAGASGQACSRSYFSTAELVARLNRHLYANTPPEKFASFCLGLYDESTAVLTYTNAGHPPPLLVRRGSVLRFEIHGAVVGAFPSSRYGESSVRLEPGDLLVCFTDGVTEPENEYGEMFGEQRLIEVILRNAMAEPAEIVAAIEQAVREWCGAMELQDDLTLMVARKL
ncbi:MAG: PP2C family protein-serine/threonine phosphatase, partial [Bryobacterales bacterium]|nr:PP2C family protein-serine/threonine phosphatase [Bryobacteraceae bacterium]MDW8132022.1 PP2C family protein-serine/threonine phosphatase [Bryobacterales bacterium]